MTNRLCILEHCHHIVIGLTIANRSRCSGHILPTSLVFMLVIQLLVVGQLKQYKFHYLLYQVSSQHTLRELSIKSDFTLSLPAINSMLTEESDFEVKEWQRCEDLHTSKPLSEFKLQIIRHELDHDADSKWSVVAVKLCKPLDGHQAYSVLYASVVKEGSGLVPLGYKTMLEVDDEY